MLELQANGHMNQAEFQLSNSHNIDLVQLPVRVYRLLCAWALDSHYLIRQLIFLSSVSIIYRYKLISLHGDIARDLEQSGRFLHTCLIVWGILYL